VKLFQLVLFVAAITLAMLIVASFVDSMLQVR
jgi:hypothetical protein